MTRVSGQPVFILHRYEYGETSLVLECLTPEFGRVGVLAKGVRRANAGYRNLDPFAPLLIGWSGRGELPVLTHMEPYGIPLALSGRALWCGFYVNELVMALLHRHDAHPGIFHAYARVLKLITDEGRQDAELRLFELVLLRELGYGLMLDGEAGNRVALEPDTLYRYAFDSGPCKGTGDGVPVHGRTLIALGCGQIGDGEARREARRLLKAAIDRQLRAPLRTPELFRQISQHATLVLKP
ncbi:MAG: DNA repair protein RecO [Acidiferrobacteraceae bacterium]